MKNMSIISQNPVKIRKTPVKRLTNFYKASQNCQIFFISAKMSNFPKNLL